MSAMSLLSAVRKILWIDTEFDQFALKVFGRSVFAYRKHIIMSFCTEKCAITPASPGKFRVIKTTPDDIITLKQNGYHTEWIERYFARDSHLRELFTAWDDEGRAAGRIGILYRGAKTIGFNVRNIDALITDVLVAEGQRRNGCCVQMIREVCRYLHDEKNVDTVYLLVRVRNTPAINAYRKAGGTEDFCASTFRFCKINFPLRGYDL